MKMTSLFFILVFSSLWGCTSIEPPNVIEQEPDSCSLFWEEFYAHRQYMAGSDSTFFVLGDWAEADSGNLWHMTNFELAFYENRDCIIGLTPENVVKLLGKPTAITTIGTTEPFNSYIYYYKRKPQDRTIPIRFLEGHIVVDASSDTIQEVATRSGRGFTIK